MNLNTDLEVYHEQITNLAPSSSKIGSILDDAHNNHISVDKNWFLRKCKTEDCRSVLNEKSQTKHFAVRIKDSLTNTPCKSKPMAFISRKSLETNKIEHESNRARTMRRHSLSSYNVATLNVAQNSSITSKSHSDVHNGQRNSDRNVTTIKQNNIYQRWLNNNLKTKAQRSNSLSHLSIASCTTSLNNICQDQMDKPQCEAMGKNSSDHDRGSSPKISSCFAHIEASIDKNESTLSIPAVIMFSDKCKHPKVKRNSLPTFSGNELISIDRKSSHNHSHNWAFYDEHNIKSSQSTKSSNNNDDENITRNDLFKDDENFHISDDGWVTLTALTSDAKTPRNLQKVLMIPRSVTNNLFKRRFSS